MTVAPTTDSPATDQAPAGQLPAEPPLEAPKVPQAAVLTQLQNAAKLAELMDAAWVRCETACDAALLEYSQEVSRLQAAAAPWIRGD